MAVVSMRALLETGVHFGHRTRRWNPKMKPYIFTERNGIHILDLQQTLLMIEDAYNVIRDTVAQGGEVLFVGTKRQAQDTVAYEAGRAGQPYVNERWLGGTLTNWQTIRQRIDYLDKLERRQEEGEFDLLKKRERLRVEREIEKLSLRLGGIRKMKDLPELLFVVDTNHEETAVREANILNIPVIGIVDTNSDPDHIDYLIPSNDDAIRAIKLICSKMADAALEGQAVRRDSLIEDTQQDIIDMERYRYDEDFDDDASDEDLLGASTLAKLRRQRVDDEDDDEFDEDDDIDVEDSDTEDVNTEDSDDESSDDDES
jgi:small subunit ribosomal protein S2